MFFILFIIFFFGSPGGHAKVLKSKKEICPTFQALKAPKGDQPKNSGITKLKGCNSFASYYGINQKKDYEKARLCAFAEIVNENDGLFFGGSNILMMIYANGFGVKRNISLAKYFSCKVTSSPAEFDGRLRHLEKLRKSSESARKFDFCDDVTSNYAWGHCRRLQEDIKSSENKKAFETLQTAFNEYLSKRLNEFDSSGAARAAMLVEVSMAEKKDFFDSLKQFEQGQIPSFSDKEIKDSISALEKIYSEIESTNTKEWSSCGTVTKSHIKIAQEAWTKYRDEWIKFATYKFTKAQPSSISAFFTKKRWSILKEFSYCIREK